jgi:UDP-N-acetylglucosamine enolpyruvyl transferase
MNERINAHVVQATKETVGQGQEIRAASSSLLASIKEHKEQMGVTVENLNQEISKSREYTDNKLKYVDSKFSKMPGEIQDIKQHSSAGI